MKQTSHQSQHQLYWNESSHFKQLLLANNYFLVTSWVLFLISYFLKIMNFSAQLLFWRSFFFRIKNYSEHLLFRSGYFFRTATFSGEELFLRADISWKQSLFLIVLRNQFHSIYTWKGFPLVSIHSLKYAIWSDLTLKSLDALLLKIWKNV